jgi:curved DNA-binding protein CbpA
MNHYETLGVAKDADMMAIKKAWRRKASKAHTDRRGGDHSQMVALNRAYETLSDPEKRSRYDQTGEDKPAPSPDSQAMELIMQVFGQMVDQAPDHEDVIALTRSNLERTLSEVGQKQKIAARQAETLEKKRKRLKHKAKKTERNFLDDLIVQRIDQLKKSAAHMAEGTALFTRALERLDDYTYKAEKQPETSSGLWSAYVMYNTAGSR